MNDENIFSILEMQSYTQITCLVPAISFILRYVQLTFYCETRKQQPFMQLAISGCCFSMY